MENNKSKLKLNKKHLCILIILAIICILIVVGLVFLIKLIFSKEIIAGNLSNTGLAYEDNNVVYYNKYDKGIVKIKGGKEYQITDESASSITVIGDTIYYLTVSSSNTIDLKSVKTNGDALTNIKTLYTPVSKFYIEDGYLYYITNKDVQGIAKLSLETREEKVIISENIQDFVLDDEKIYFTDNVGYLHSISLNGGDYTDISKDYPIKKIQILKKWIYFYNENENSLCKINKNGTKMKTVSTFVNNEIYNVTSKYIYYYDAVNNQICRCDLNGKKSNAIVKITTTRPKINIANGILYYLDNSQNQNQIYQMYRVKENGGVTNSIDY